MDFVVNHFTYHFISSNVLNTMPVSIFTDILFCFACLSEFRFYDPRDWEFDGSVSATLLADIARFSQKKKKKKCNAQRTLSRLDYVFADD